MSEGGEGSTLIGTLSQIFSFFFSDASPNKYRPRIRIVGSPQGSNGVDKATKKESVSGISKHASSVAAKLLEDYASDDDFIDLSKDKDEYEALLDQLQEDTMTQIGVDYAGYLSHPDPFSEEIDGEIEDIIGPSSQKSGNVSEIVDTANKGQDIDEKLSQSCF